MATTTMVAMLLLLGVGVVVGATGYPSSSSGGGGAEEAEDLPRQCEVGVVGAGFSGIYFAWRLGVDARKVDPAGICIFEVNGRVGGRIYTVRDYKIDGLEMPVDVGGYRVREMDKLPYDLVTRRLKLPVSCYDFDCAATCDGSDTTCYNVNGAYGHSQFSLTMETMMRELKGLGAKVFFGAEVTDVREPTPSWRWRRGSADLVVRRGGRTYRVNAKLALLNVPSKALREFPADGLLGASGGAKATLQECLEGSYTIPATKVYAVYDNAWWYSVLGKMQGSFGNRTEELPLAGRYHDGPVRCVVGEGRDGGAVYSETPVAFGNCTGALLVHYTLFFDNAWEGLQVRPEASALSVFTPRNNASLLERTHRVLMDHHADELRAKGVDPSSLAPPKAILMGNFNDKNKYTTFSASRPCRTDRDKLKEIRRPHPRHNVFLANHDYGYDDLIGWATAGLHMAEKVLQAELRVPAPRWLDRAYYRKHIVNIP